MQDSIIDRITINSEICHGNPTIRAKTYPVESMLDLLASDMEIEELLLTTLI